MFFNPSFWLVAAVVLLVLEIFTGLFVSLAFGIAAVAVFSVLKWSPGLIESWYVLLSVYGLFGLLLSTALWKVFGKKRNSYDINQ